MLQVWLLGQFEVRVDGKRANIAARAAQSLLAYLILTSGTPHRREKLAGLLWPEMSDDNARNNLRHELWRVRKAITAPEYGAAQSDASEDTPPEFILAEDLTIAFNSDANYWLDVAQMEKASADPQSLISGLSLYRGELLPGFYDDWVSLERERVQAIFEGKMQQLLKLLIAEQRWQTVLEWAERWIGLGQTPEPAYRALMLGYAALGDNAKVAETYERCVAALDKELGVEPAPETQSQYDEIMRGDRVALVNLSARQYGVKRAPALPAASPAPGEPPFKGLQYFDESDAALFFGREELVSRLVDELSAQRFLAVVVGASGSGKSSVVRAGVIPALKGNNAHWQVYVLTPTAHPLEALALELTRDSESVTATATLLDDLNKDPRALHFWLRRQTTTDPRLHGRRVLLAIDQFEELFTLCRDEVEREVFIDTLLSATSPYAPPNNGGDPDRSSKVTLVITIRADFYAHLAQYPELREAAAKQQEYIGPMTSEELRRAIEEPLKQGAADGTPWEFEPGLVDLMLRDAEDEPGALPLLSHALLETWKRRSGHLMTLKGYAEAGGVRGAIAQTAETVYLQFTPHEQDQAREIFLRLTELGEGTEDTRRRASFGELIPRDENAASVHSVLVRLADARLITLHTSSAEVAHEALIREWPQLREWLSRDREGLHLHRHITEAAQEWELLERDPGALYRGARLAQAQEYAVANPRRINALEHAFLAVSEEQAKREIREREELQQRELEQATKLADEQARRLQEQGAANRRLRRRAYVLVGAVVLALLAASAAVFFLNQSNANLHAVNEQRDAAQKESRISTARELAASAQGHLTSDPERSTLLALQAIDATAPDNVVLTEAEAALHSAVQAVRVVKTLRGHTAQVWSLAVNPAGTQIASISVDGTTKLWDIATGKALLTLQTNITVWDGKGVMFTPDGTRLLTVADGNVAKLWDLSTGKEMRSLGNHSLGMTSVAVSADGKKFATSSLDGAVNVWDAASGENLRTLYLPGSAVFVAFSPDSRRLLTAGYEDSNIGRVTVWNAESGEKLLALDDQPGVVYGVASNPDGTLIATSGFDETIKLWDGATGKLVATLFGHSTLVAEVAFSPDGKLLASGSDDGTAKIWDAKTGQLLLTLAGHSGGILGVAFTPDGSRLATASRDGTVRIWDITPKGDREWLTLQPTNGRVLSAVYSPDGTRIATSGSEGILQVWDAASGKALFQIAADQDSPHGLALGIVRYSADGKRIVTDGGATPRVFDAEAGAPLLTLPPISGRVSDVVFSPDGTRIAVAGQSGKLKIHDSATGQVILDFFAHTARINQIEYSPDGTRLATGGDDGRAQIFDSTTGKLLLKIDLFPNRVNGIAYSPDGKRLATAGSDGTIKVWDALLGSELFTLRGHTGQASGLAFSPDGQMLATSSADSTIKLWKLPRPGEPLQEPLTLYGHKGGVYRVAFSPDGTRLLSASRDGTARVYAARLQDLIELARSKLTRGLTADECEKYLHVDQCPPSK